MIGRECEIYEELCELMPLIDLCWAKEEKFFRIVQTGVKYFTTILRRGHHIFSLQ